MAIFALCIHGATIDHTTATQPTSSDSLAAACRRLLSTLALPVQTVTGAYLKVAAHFATMPPLHPHIVSQQRACYGRLRRGLSFIAADTATQAVILPTSNLFQTPTHRLRPLNRYTQRHSRTHLWLALLSARDQTA